jgi:formate hydrogenlyase subunit 6/NADH:ubiquinone oxidoreductase subunit I
MRIGSMIGDIIHSLFKRPVTERYPFESAPLPGNFRGKLHYDPAKCSGCQLCVKDCPANAIELLVVDKVNKRFVMRYHLDRCTFCDQCAFSCRFQCINLSKEEWELAALTHKPFTVYYGKEEDVHLLLERAARLGSTSPSDQHESEE